VPDFQLSERVAIVTGASRGLGAAIAEGLAEHGARVVLSSRKQADLEAEAALIERRFGEGRAIPIAAHAGREPDLRHLVEETLRRAGRIDILVNNAGTNPYFGPLIDADLGVWDKTFEVNLRGYFILTQLVVQAWMGEHGGAILNVASTGGLRPSPLLGIYDITKAGVIMLTRQLAKELGGKVRVNCLAPGLFRTRFAQALWGNPEILERVLQANPMGRIGEPPEITGAAVFLVSDAAAYVNGQVLVLDGGGGEGL
jgi:NAD(P)-dependent dehydrogenase (short-subunit alcohol dehydrogenase family)